MTNEERFRNFQYLEPEKEIGNVAELRSEHDLKLRYKTGLAANFSARGIYNYVNRERSRMFVNEAYLAVNKNKLNLKVGKQIFKYGKLTGVSNLDLANTYDYFDFIKTDNEELGQWGLTSKFEIKSFRVDLNYIYDLSPSIAYFEDNPWVKLPSQLISPSEPGVVMPIQFRDVINVNADQKRSSFDLGLNFDLLGMTARLDYYHGYNDILFRRLNLDLVSQSIPIQYDLELSIQPLSIYNLSVQKLFGDWNTWVEFGFIKNYFTAENGAIQPDNYYLPSLGVDRAFLFEDPAKMLKLMVQWRWIISIPTI